MKAAIVLPMASGELLTSLRAAQRSVELPPDIIRVQLARILKSDGFVRAQRMRRFLGFIVEETLAGRSGELCEYSIGMSVFGRNESFEPGLDPIVRNDARRLRQKLLEYYQQARRKGDSDVVIDMPKGSYVPVFKRGSQNSGVRHEYRLTITLTRIADGAEIWTTQHEY
ncbi:MAG TPA: hypothetical protein VN633_20475 [Bryobacteraceae bacterium]|nr:hypothetical protein [Bryobacteraceae bacterium]